MARNQKYYWMKLPADFFEDDAIQWLKEQPDGEKYALFYIELCLKSLKTEGVLIRRVGDMLIPYDAEMLARLTNTDVTVVVVALELLKRIKLVEILENGEIYLSAVESMTGKETASTIRSRKCRALQAENALALQCNTDATQEQQNCNREKEIEKEIEKEKKKESSKRAFTPPSEDELKEYCKENQLCFINPQEFIDFYQSKGWMVGKTKMKDWKAAARRWNRQNEQKGLRYMQDQRVDQQKVAANDALERRRRMVGG